MVEQGADIVVDIHGGNVNLGKSNNFMMQIEVNKLCKTWTIQTATMQTHKELILQLP